MTRWLNAAGLRAAAVLVVPLALAACLFLPGKFESVLTVNADRSFTFTYKGEVVAADLEGAMGEAFKGMGDSAKTETPKDSDSDTAGETPSEDETPAAPDPAEEAAKKAEEAAKKAKKEADYKELAVQLAKEAGYRTVEYRGEGVFYVDYAISGVLTHGFVYPYDLDTAMVFPWVSIELRGKDGIRIKAPGFAKQDSSSTMGMGSLGESKIDGSFTLITDAEVLSQNDESGGTSANGKRIFRWRVTPRTTDAPLAVLKVKSL
jgi:hypothetical protein